MPWTAVALASAVVIAATPAAQPAGDGTSPSSGSQAGAPQPYTRLRHDSTTARIIAEQHAGNVSATVPAPPATAAAVPNAPPVGPQLSGLSTTVRLETEPPGRSMRSRSAVSTAERLPGPADPILHTVPTPIAGVAAVPPNGPLQACVDHELARRDLNGYGDPPATRYPAGPPEPADSIRRYAYVLDRSPAIRIECAAGATARGPFR